MWYVIIHLTFVLSAFVMGYLDRLDQSETLIPSLPAVLAAGLFLPV